MLEALNIKNKQIINKMLSNSRTNILIIFQMKNNATTLSVMRKTRYFKKKNIMTREAAIFEKQGS